MKKKLLTLLMALVAIVACAFDQGDFNYSVNSDGTATLNGFKSGATFSSTILTIPGYVWDATAQKRYQVKKIAWGAFNPNIKISFATQLRAITRVTINYGVEELDASVFYNCTSLRLADLPSSIRKMGAYVFGDCPITNINCAVEIMPTFVDNLTFSSMGTVSGTRYFTCATPDGMTAANAVSHITGNFTVQWSHTAADFTGWTMGKNTDGNLFDVYYNVVEPGDPAHSNVYGKVKLLGANKRASTTNFTLAFSYDQSINKDAIYYYVTEIDKSMRYRCSDVQVLDMSQTSKVEKIGDYAFYGSTALTKVITKAKSIGNYAFRNCTNLTTLTLGEGVQMIGTQCFAHTGLKYELNMPESLYQIGGTAFYGCNSLPSVFINRTGSTTYGNQLFSSSQSTKLYVPLSEMYRVAQATSGWLNNTSGTRKLLPYIKPTTRWSAIAVPVSDNILLPTSGEFYAASGYNNSVQSLDTERLTNSKGVSGNVGLLFKGTVGTVYRFRDKSELSNPGSYTAVTPQNNYLKAVTGLYQNINSSTGTSGPWRYSFDGTTEKFNKLTSTTTLYSGTAYLELSASNGATSAVSTVSILMNEVYDLYVGGTRVTGINCGDLSVIGNVTGTVNYNPVTKTLTLRNATIKHGKTGANTYIGIHSMIDGLIIDVQGTNKLLLEPGGPDRWAKQSIALEGMTTITGTGTLECQNDSSSCIQIVTTEDGFLNVEGGVQLKLNSGFAAISNYRYAGDQGPYNCMTVSGGDTKVTMNGQKYTTNNVSPVLNDGLTITQPAGAYFTNSGYVATSYWEDNTLHVNLVKGQDVVIKAAEYDLYVGGTRVTGINCGDLSVIGNVTGTVNYNPVTKTLTLRNATIKHGKTGANTYIGIHSMIDGLIIDVQGTNKLLLEPGGPDRWAKQSIALEGMTTITGTGTLECQNDSSSCIQIVTTEDGFLNVEGGVQLKLNSGFAAISNYRYAGDQGPYNCMTVSGGDTKVTMNGQKYTTNNVSPVLNDGLTITQPAGAYFTNSGYVATSYWEGNTLHVNLVKDQDVVISKPAGLRGDINGDGAVDALDVNLLVNVVLGKAQASQCPGNADVNDDGTVDVNDVNIVINIMLGKQ